MGQIGAERVILSFTWAEASIFSRTSVFLVLRPLVQTELHTWLSWFPVEDGRSWAFSASMVTCTDSYRYTSLFPLGSVSLVNADLYRWGRKIYEERTLVFGAP